LIITTKLGHSKKDIFLGERQDFRNSRSKLACIFSDIDGTLVHYPDSESQDEADIIKLPPSKSGMCGIISVKTLDLARKIQLRKVMLVLTSAVRLATFQSRLPFLPNANAYIIENGGKIFWNRSAPDGCERLEEDNMWFKSNITPFLHSLDRCRELLSANGLMVDCDGYTGMFRVRLKDTPEKIVEIERIVTEKFPDLSLATNLGFVDVFPASSGKRNAAHHVMSTFGLEIANCAMICDDDNDMPLAVEMGQGAYVTQATAMSVEQQIKINPSQFVLATKTGTASTEELLLLILNKLDTESDSKPL